MSFYANDYLSWYMDRAFRNDGAISLHASGVHALDAAAGPAVRGHPMHAVREFEETLAAWLGIPAAELIYTPGATGGTLLALLSLAAPGRTVLVDLPMYEPMVRQALRLNPVRRLHRSFDNGWALPVDDAARVLPDRVSMIMLCEPGNPSGRFSSRKDVLELARLAGRHGVYLLINEVYRGYSDRPSYHGAADNILVVSSLSKLIGAYFLRLGWVSGPADVIGKLRMAHMNMGMGNAPCAAAGVAVVRDQATEVRKLAMTTSAAGSAIMDQWVQATPGLAWHPSQGPGFGCVRLSPGIDDMDLANRLHDERGVLLVPGTLFELPGFVRISWLQAGDRFRDGLAAVADALAATRSA